MDAAAACVLTGSIGNAITHLSGRNSIIKNTVFYHGRCYYSDSYVGVMCCDVYSQLFLLLEYVIPIYSMQYVPECHITLSN